MPGAGRAANTRVSWPETLAQSWRGLGGDLRAWYGAPFAAPGMARLARAAEASEDGVEGLMASADQSDFGSTWFSRVTSLPPARTPLNYEIDVDVCVVGGGLAGLTVAREVVRRAGRSRFSRASKSPGTPPGATAAW